MVPLFATLFGSLGVAQRGTTGVYCNTVTVYRLYTAYNFDSNFDFRFDGKNFKTEPSSTFPHRRVNVLGRYQGKPFVTGSNQPSNIKTEILDEESSQWNQAADYPFSFDGDRLAKSF